MLFRGLRRGEAGLAGRMKPLSAGHASILQYAVLHLASFGLTLDDLKDFRRGGQPRRDTPRLATPPALR